MVEQNFEAEAKDKGQSAGVENAVINELQDDLKTGTDNGLKKAQVLPEDIPGGELPEGFEEFLGELFDKLQQGSEAPDMTMERPERHSDAMRNFDKVQDDINLGMLNAFRDNQPALREAIGETDRNLLDKSNAYVLESYESGRLERLTTGRDELSNGILDIQEDLKKIPLWEDQVEVVKLLNGVFAPSTDPEARKLLLENIAEDNPELAKKAEALAQVQDRLKPDVEEDLKRREVVHQAYNESQEARMTYSHMLNQMSSHPSVKANEAGVLSEEMFSVNEDGLRQQADFGRYSTLPDINNFGLKFPEPDEPRRLSA